MGYFADDDEFIEEFWDRRWAPTPGIFPGYREFMFRRLDVFTQVILAQATLPFLNAIDNQLSEIVRKPGVHPLLKLPYSFIASEMRKSLHDVWGTPPWPGAPPPVIKPGVYEAYKMVRAGTADRKQETCVKRFLVRCWESWLRRGWEWPWKIEKPPPWAEPGTEKVREIILALRREVEARRLPPPRVALPPPALPPR